MLYMEEHRIGHEGSDGGIFPLYSSLLNNTLAWIILSSFLSMEIEVFSQCLYDRAETPIIPETLIVKGLIAWNCHTPTHLT